VFQQAGRLLHLSIYDFEYFSIVDGIGDIVCHHGATDVALHIYRHDELASRDALLWHHAVTGVKPHLVNRYPTLFYCHFLRSLEV
jgi:hypothetical protein